MNREVTTPQIVLFGLTGGLLPCPAAFSVLIVCMQVKQFTLGFALVARVQLRAGADDGDGRRGRGVERRACGEEVHRLRQC